jgi:integrase/recombinase XerD
MVNVNDANNAQGKLENQWENLRDADIPEKDRETIEQFVRLERKGNQGLATNTLTSDLSTLRNASERAETPLVEMDMADVQSLLGTLTAPKSAGGYGLDPSGSGMYNYKRSLRVFFRWLDDQPRYGDFDLAESIELPSQRASRVDEQDMLDQDDIAELRDAATNPRDRALIEFLADTGARVGLASQLRVGDIYDLDTQRPYYRPNPNGVGHKGAPNKEYPILHSHAELRQYINHHHVDPRDGAPLWHLRRGYDRDNPQEGAMSEDRIRDMLRECKRRCSVEKPVNPHNFRHSAITRLSKQGYTPQEIEHIAAWVTDEMLENYDHTTARERNEQLRAKAGFIDEVETESKPAEPSSCGNCRTLVKPGAQFCPNCGAPVTKKARISDERFEEDIFESAVTANGDLVEAVRELRELVDEHPGVRRAILDE